MLKKLRLLSLALIGTLLPLITPVATANATTIYASSYFRSFDADYYLEKDDEGKSVLRVVEEITAVFPDDSEEHGITRILPFTGEEDLTDEKTLAITATRNGQPENIARIITDDDNFELRVGNANRTVSGVQTYRLEYTYRNVITTEKTHQELYWNTNGTGWTKPFLELNARVHFGDGIEKAYTGDYACYVGRYGSSGQSRCTVSKISDGLEFSAEKLNARENLTFAIAFDPKTFKDNEDDGYILDTKTYTDNRLIVMVIVAGALGLVLVGVGIVAWRSVSAKRKFYKGYFIKPEYTPPAGFSVAEMSENYIGKSYGSKQVATLLTLAVNHKVELIKTETDGLFGKKVPAWKVRIKSNEMTKQQLIVLKILAGSDTNIHVGQEIDIKTHTANSALIQLGEDFTKNIKERLEEKGLLEPTAKDSKTAKTAEPTASTAKSKPKLSGILSVCAAIWVIAWIFVIIFSFDEDSLPNYVTLPNAALFGTLLAAILIGVVIFLIVVISNTSHFEKHTEKGLEYSRYLDGLKLYMKMVEADRLKMLQSVDGADTTNEGIVKLYEKLLPYAIIFQLEKSWLDELSHYYEQPDVTTPAWYIGMGAFSARDFSSAMTQMSSAASSTIVSSSSSSSSSGGGIGGGGFSGGGGGGGGGGTW